MKGIVIFTAVLMVTSAQVVFPGDEEPELPTADESSADVSSGQNSFITSLELDRTNLPSQAVNGDFCRTPDGSIGDCVSFSECSSYSHLVPILSNTTVLSFLRARVCRLLGKQIYVCCPKINQPESLQSTIFPSACGESYAGQRIIQGTEVEVGSYPWLAALGRRQPGRAYFVNCGGSLITNRHVLTAAHCFGNPSFDPTHALLGEHNVTSDNDGANPVFYTITETILADYNKRGKQNDLAILKLDREVIFNNDIQPICLPFRDDLKNNNFNGIHLDIVGWGRQEAADRTSTSDVPLEAKVEGRTLEDCQQAYSVIQVKLTEQQLCAGTGGTDACIGDSGGPLHYLDEKSGRFYLVGVTSFGRGCGRKEFPGVYTRVSAYQSWIEQSV